MSRLSSVNSLSTWNRVTDSGKSQKASPVPVQSKSTASPTCFARIFYDCFASRDKRVSAVPCAKPCTSASLNPTWVNCAAISCANWLPSPSE
jgi:hypothetical protein